MNFYQQLQHETADERQSLHAAPIVQAAIDGRVSREQYIDFLVRAYHHVRHTTPLMMAAGARLSFDQGWLRRALLDYAEEELGHDEWILSDIAAVGGDAGAVQSSAPDFDTDVMIAYAYDTVTRRNPVGLLGMVHVLEGTSVSLASTVAASLQKELVLPGSAFTYLTSHGSLDVAHVAHFEALVNQLRSPADQRCVVASAKTMFRLYGNVLQGVETQVTA
ncbi:MAG: iron-containing redox enzyme family protein [Burkholderiaceae bacterium]